MNCGGARCGKECQVLTIKEAQAVVMAAVTVLPPERIPLLQALGCVLAETVVAPIQLPPFDNSAMDGFAVVAEDTRGATPGSPARLEVLEDVPAGATPERQVRHGKATRVMTGAPIPPGADAVVIVEHTRAGPVGTIEIFVRAAPGDNIRPAGEDIAAGETALSPGQSLGPGELGLISALGQTHVAVIRRPRVAIITTGSELVEPGQELRPGTIYNSNQAAIAASVLKSGWEVAHCLHVADDESALEQALRGCADADLLLTTGGVSVGEHDFVKVVLDKIGDIRFWRVLMKPCKPVAFGTVFGRPLFGLPGNPVSALVTFEMLVAPALRKMSGRKDCLPLAVQATLLSEVRHRPGRREYRQSVARCSDGDLVVEPSQKRGSAMLTSTVGANSLLVIPEESTGLAAGERVTVILLGHGGDEL
jgi:molybdopterin molybdotransferase